MVVASSYQHTGPARLMVHRLKYEAIEPVAVLLARSMRPLLPTAAAGLVPVPRRVVRTWRYGIDQGMALAVALSHETGLPVVPALRAPLLAPRHAGRSRGRRPPPRFGANAPVDRGAVLVDDVLTTGSTLAAAQRATGGAIRWAVTATAVHEVTSLHPDPGRPIPR